jgi:MYXO-CTERM domain-containing protein
MNLFLRPALAAGAMLSASALHAAIMFTASETLTSGNAIADAPFAGLARELTVDTGARLIESLSITLDIGSAPGDLAWNGDLYVQLSGPSGTLAVLLNRAGTTPSDDTGYGDAGFNITIGTGSLPDVHEYQGVSYSLNGSGQLTGTWASDGREDATSASRDRMLDQFIGQNPNGTWTLLVTDLASGNAARLNSWSIEGVGAVPEPGEWTALAGLALAGFAAIRRRRASLQ